MPAGIDKSIAAKPIAMERLDRPVREETLLLMAAALRDFVHKWQEQAKIAQHGLLSTIETHRSQARKCRKEVFDYTKCSHAEAIPSLVLQNLPLVTKIRWNDK
jgi:hypothetical protein